MCGYCIEKLVLVGIAKKETFEQMAMPEASPIYLQEAGDLLSAIREIKKVCRSERASAREHLDKHIVMARLLETLWREGIESQVYERLAWNAAIHQVLRHKETPASFTDAGTIFPLDPFQEIYRPATYLDKGKWETFCARPEIIGDCRDLIDVYICRWLKGVGFEQYNRVQKIESKHYNIPDPEWTRLLIALPALIFSMLVLASAGEDEDRIRFIMLTEPVEARPFDAPTLWLQRKAAELLFDAKGISPFIPYDPGIRQIVVAYLAQKKNLPSFTRKRLAKSILNVVGKFDINDENNIAFLLL